MARMTEAAKRAVPKSEKGVPSKAGTGSGPMPETDLGGTPFSLFATARLAASVILAMLARISHGLAADYLPIAIVSTQSTPTARIGCERKYARFPALPGLQ